MMKQEADLDSGSAKKEQIERGLKKPVFKPFQRLPSF